MSLFACEKDKSHQLVDYSWISTNYYSLSTINSSSKFKLAYDNALEANRKMFFSYLQNLVPMNSIVTFFLLSSLFISTQSLKIQQAKPNAHITVMGFVYCDICSNNSFSRHSYFLPGAEVTIDCKFKTFSPRTREQMSFSVNRTTNRYGIYKLEIPSVDGIACADAAIASSCQASLMWSSSTSCNVPGYRSTTNQIAIKSKQANLCIYSLNALTFRPSKRDITLCGK